MIFRVNPSSGIPLYLQLMEQVKHAVETGALREGDQLPTIRKVAEELVMNPNTVVRAYRELEHEGVLELRHGAGAFIKASGETRARLIRRAQTAMEGVIERLMEQGLTEDELRRAFESELAKAEERRATMTATTGTATTGTATTGTATTGTATTGTATTGTATTGRKR